MRVVVTRPAHSAERTAERLRKLGHDPVLLPLAYPVHRPEAALRALASSQGAIAVTSAEAIRALASLGEALEAHLSRPLFAVGKATAEAAKTIGFKTVHNSQGSGAELADLIAENRGLLDNLPLLYLAGSPRSAGFEARLADLALSCEPIECYAMRDEEPTEDQLRHVFLSSRADAVLLYSRHTAEIFAGLPFFRKQGDALATTKLLCMSEAVASAIPESWRQNSLVAASPDEAALFELLDRP